MSPTGDLLVTFIFLWGRCPLELAQRPSCVALVLHLARRSTPFWVTIGFDSLLVGWLLCSCYAAMLLCCYAASIFRFTCFLDFGVQTFEFSPPTLLRKPYFVTGRLLSPVAFGTMVMKCGETVHVLQTVLMAYPDQVSSLQGSCGVSCNILAANDLGIGSGWQQSRQNWALLAVVGK